MTITRTQKIVLQVITLMLLVGMGIHEIILCIDNIPAMLLLMIVTLTAGLWQAELLVACINEK